MACSVTWSTTGSASRSGRTRVPTAASWNGGGRTGRRCTNLLHHPSYAGAYRFGHRPIDPRRKQPGRPTTGKLIRRPEECLVLIRDRLAGVHHLGSVPGQPGAARRQPGAAGRPAHRARGPRCWPACCDAGGVAGGCSCVYSGPKNRPCYNCTRGSADYGDPLCQSLSGPVLDDLVAGQILAAVEPAALEASLAAVAEVERERAELTRHWQLRRERARYEVDRRGPAISGVRAGEPPGRPRAGASLGGVAEVTAATRRRVRALAADGPRPALARRSSDAIRALAADLPAVWRAATTTPAERQRIARLLIEHVELTVDKASERVDVDCTGSAARSSRTPVPAGEALRPAGRLPATGRSGCGRCAEERSARRRSPSGSTARGSGRRSGPTASTGVDGAAADGSPGADPSPAPRQLCRAWATTSIAQRAWRGGWRSPGTRCGVGSVPAG